ncbi:MAG: alanine--glyoxylate aminotransferase family protein [Desulfurococcales archaeon]|nr:alanine--glyoxylate aminotransferase family protein [Desulfurococcales archaeon]
MAKLLMIPGPTPVAPEVLLSSAAPVISHTSPEFDEIHSDALRMLAKVFETKGPIVLLPGSGSLAMEFASRSIVEERGEKALVLKAGYFGGYLEKALRAAGAEVKVVEAPLGRGFRSEDLARALDESGASIVAFQHVETSTSVANPVGELAGEAKRKGAKVLVDGVASIGGMEMRMEEWGVDVCLTGSQKALSTPPGLAIVAYSSKAKRLLERDGEGLYFDFKAVAREMESTRNYHFTPAVNLVIALRESLRRILSEGLAERYRRHKVLARAVQAGVEALGLKIVAEEGFRADTVTAIWLPEGIQWPKLYAEMKARGVEIAGGLGELKGRIFRIGHMGEVDANDVTATLAALERSLRRQGYKVELGVGVKAAQEVLAEEGF